MTAQQWKETGNRSSPPCVANKGQDADLGTEAKKEVLHPEETRESSGGWPQGFHRVSEDGWAEACWGEGLEWGSYLQVIRAGDTESRLTDN